VVSRKNTIPARRGLGDDFFKDLANGPLKDLAADVRRDRTLDLGIRDDYVNVYYRGGSLLRVSGSGRKYTAFFDKKYAGSDPSPQLGSFVESDPTTWVPSIPFLKQVMDGWFDVHPKEEREVQQRIIHENNRGGMAASTDYFFCDIEYAVGQARFDLIGVHWPSNGVARKKVDDAGLVLAEVKHGDSALQGAAGIRKHVEDACRFASDPGKVRHLKEEMRDVFNQKRQLHLIDCKRDLGSFREARPVLLFILANHDPASTVLSEVLRDLPDCPALDIRFATSSFMGYGLFDEGIHSRGELVSLHGRKVCSQGGR